VRASISIPTLFLPVVENETLMVDGGLLNPLPLSAASLKEGSMLVAVDVNAPIEYESPVKTVHDHEREGKYKQALEMMNHRWSQMIGHNHDSAADNHKIKQAGLFEVITESLAIMQEELTKNAILEFKPDLLIEVSRKCASIYDFYKAEELIEAGRHACLAALQKPSHARKEMLGRAV
jgi:NTE family protein